MNLKSFKFRILKENSLQPVRSWFCLLFILGLFLPACILPAGASVIPGDSSGDTCVSDEELASSILSYMEYSHLGKEGPHLSAEELSLAAHNFRNIPYGRVVIPVLSEGDFITPNIWYKMGVPTGSLIYEGLVTRNRDGNYDSWLAESWNSSEDTKIWTFRLKKAKWQDGEPVSSEDVKFTHDYLKDKKLKLAFVLNYVERVECPDARTAVFYLENSDPTFPDRLSHSPGIAIFPKHIWENVENPASYDEYASGNTHFIGSGPFKYKAAERGQYFLLEANEAYHGDGPYVKEVALKLIPDASSRLFALQSGEIDVLPEITSVEAEKLKGKDNIKVYNIPDATGYEIAFNCEQVPANDPLFRQALSHAVNRGNAANMLGNAEPTETVFLLPDLAHDFVNPDCIGKYDYDLEKTRSLFKASDNFSVDSDGKVRYKNGDQIRLKIPLGGKAHINRADEKLLNAIKMDWEDKLGFDVEFEVVPKDIYLEEIGESPIFIDGMPGTMHDDVEDLNNFYRSPTGSNYYHYDNPKYNRLMEELKNTTDRDKRKEIGYRMQAVLAEDVPTIPVCSTGTLVAYRTDRFTGWESVMPLQAGILDKKVFLNIKPVSSQAS